MTLLTEGEIESLEAQLDMSLYEYSAATACCRTDLDHSLYGEIYQEFKEAVRELSRLP